MTSFTKNEFVLCFSGINFGRDDNVSIERVAESVPEGKEKCLVYFGHYTTQEKTCNLHKMPASMKKIIKEHLKLREGK
jgi:hypothetical protein